MKLARHALVWFHVAASRFFLNQSHDNWYDYAEARSALEYLEGKTVFDEEYSAKILEKGKALVSEFPGGEAYLNPNLGKLKQLASDVLIWFWISSNKFLANKTPENDADYQEAYAALKILDNLKDSEETVIEPMLAARIQERTNALRSEIEEYKK